MVAAEASSALFAQRLLEHWVKTRPDIKAFGVGTKAMEDLGFERIGKAEEMAVVGLAEILEQWSVLKSTFHRLVAQAEARRPDFAIVMDYPDFNLMLAKKLKALGIPVIYYISPQVWAWRKNRVHKIKKYCEKVLVLFPFEMEFYHKVGMSVEFVGHPILDEMQDKYFDEKYWHLHRQKYGIREDEVVIGLMPGSRRGEIKRHFLTQLKVAENLYREFKKIRILIMMAPTVQKEQLEEALDTIKYPYLLLKEEPFEMIHLADMILVASGTATLMVGLLHKPMVIMYRFSWLTGWIAKLIVRGVRYFGLVNLIFGKELVPERWQAGASVEELTSLMRQYLLDEDYRRKIVGELKTLQSKLGDRGATLRVAKAVESFSK